MAYKLLIILLLIFKTSYSNIIYDKNENSVTELELNTYIELYKNSFEQNLTKNKALKDIILIKNTIHSLEIENPDFISELDEILRLQFKNFEDKTSIIKDFLRFQKIRNEFISNYFQNEFNTEDLKIIFLSMNEMNFPISKNNCLTIEKLHKIELDEYFLESFFENLRENPQKITTIIDNESYDICINERLFKTIEYEIFKYIEIKTEGDFDKFIYGKIN